MVLTWLMWKVVVVLDDGGGGGGGGGKGTTDDGLRLNHASRFGHVRAALSDGHTPMLYCQIEHKVRAPR
jgi:hypothetical protein